MKTRADDLTISALDALVVINRLGRSDGVRGFYYDVTGEGDASALDALRIINSLSGHTPEITLRLSNDTDRDAGGSKQDRRTFDLGLSGRVNFGGNSPTLFVGTGTDQWVDASDRVSSSGHFEFDDAAIRALLGNVGRGATQFRLSPDAFGRHLRDIDVEVLSAPPQPRLIEAELDEDGNVVLDVLGNTYDPDSDPATVRVEIREQPSSGTLTPQDNTYIYRPVDNFHGTDRVVYEVIDEEESSGLTTLVITVASVNDEPVLTPVEDIAIKVTDGRFQFPFNATDADGEPLDVILPNEPTIESLTISATTISDTGTDPITLTANNAFHPRQSDGLSVTYYQDTNHNGIFDASIDRAIGSSGSSWTGNPLPTFGDTATFFAQASISIRQRNFFTLQETTLLSQAVMVTVPVHHTPKLASSLLNATSDETVVAANPGFVAASVAKYGEGLSALVIQDSSLGLMLQRYAGDDAVGLGTPVGAPVPIGQFPNTPQLAARADQHGNLTIVFAVGNFGGINPDGSTGSALWLMQVDAANNVTMEPTKLDSIDNGEGYEFTFCMNEIGEGFIAWQGYYSSPAVSLQTFTSAPSCRRSASSRRFLPKRSTIF